MLAVFSLFMKEFHTHTQVTAISNGWGAGDLFLFIPISHRVSVFLGHSMHLGMHEQLKKERKDYENTSHNRQSS